MARMTDRYRVSIYGRLRTATDHVGTLVDVTHGFTSKARAERFAKTIARYLPRPVGDSHPDAWVLVYALPTSSARNAEWDAVCYASFDPGGIPVKHHVIPRGYWGAPSDAPSGWCGSRA